METCNVHDDIWCVNVAICYILGIEGYEKDWKKALGILNNVEKCDNAISWWKNISVVGDKESNIVMLLLGTAGLYKDDEVSISCRIQKAITDGYDVPDEVSSEYTESSANQTQ